jgi:uncharacterized surface protein with fasciclin (FAS1) repeats
MTIYSINNFRSWNEKMTVNGRILLTLLVAASLAGCCVAQNSGNRGVIEAANSLGDLNTFVKAINQSGLTDRLNDKNALNVRNHTYIIFAPVDAAFNSLPSGTLNSLMQNKDDLNYLLGYHIIEDAKVNDIGNLQGISTLKTLDGKDLNLSYSNGLMVNGVRALNSMKYDHGIIYAIDKVLLPDDNRFLDKYNLRALRVGYVAGTANRTGAAAGMTVYNETTNVSARQPMSAAERDFLAYLNDTKDLKTFVNALTAADLGSDFYNKSNLTVFAPNDQAFSVIPENNLNRLLANRDDLRTLLRYHIIDRSSLNKDWNTTIGNVTTLQGSVLMINRTDGEFTVNKANVLKTMFYNNSIIYIIDRILLPNNNSFLDRYQLRGIAASYESGTMTNASDNFGLPPQPRANMTTGMNNTNSTNEQIYKNYNGKGF